jgi:hypothetical protein
VAKPSNNNWDPLSYSNQFEGITTSGEATANSLSAGIVWSDPPSGTDWIVVERGGNFQVTGSGTVTFAIDYSLAANRLIDASSLPYPFIGTSGVLEANLLLYIPFVIGLANDQHFIFLPDVRGSVNDSVSQSGTATVQYQLSDGGTYWLRAGAQSFLTVAVSEPPTLLLLMASFGVVGVLFSARFLRDRYAARLSEHP